MIVAVGACLGAAAGLWSVTKMQQANYRLAEVPFKKIRVFVPAGHEEDFYHGLEVYAVAGGFKHRISRYSEAKGWFGFSLWRENAGITGLSISGEDGVMIDFHEVTGSPLTPSQRAEIVDLFKEAVVSVPGATVREEI